MEDRVFDWMSTHMPLLCGLSLAATTGCLIAWSVTDSTMFGVAAAIWAWNALRFGMHIGEGR